MYNNQSERVRTTYVVENLNFYLAHIVNIERYIPNYFMLHAGKKRMYTKDIFYDVRIIHIFLLVRVQNRRKIIPTSSNMKNYLLFLFFFRRTINLFDVLLLRFFFRKKLKNLFFLLPMI